MAPPALTGRRTRPSLELGPDIGPADGPACERALLHQLAGILEEWPVRNVVVRERLDAAARELVRLASAIPDPEPLPA